MGNQIISILEREQAKNMRNQIVSILQCEEVNNMRNQIILILECEEVSIVGKPWLDLSIFHHVHLKNTLILSPWNIHSGHNSKK